MNNLIQCKEKWALFWSITFFLLNRTIKDHIRRPIRNNNTVTCGLGVTQNETINGLYYRI